jgi:uncharacterized membrane protein YeaQ/YmgE (transglycosylase-associated protein family)
MHSSLQEAIMAFLWMIIVGLVVGALAKAVMFGKDPGGILVTMLLGIAGAVVAGFIGRNMGYYQPGNEAPGIIGSVLGAVVVLFIYRLLVGRSN